MKYVVRAEGYESFAVDKKHAIYLAKKLLHIGKPEVAISKVDLIVR